VNFARNGAALFLIAVTASMVVNVVAPVDGAEPKTSSAELLGGLAGHLAQPRSTDPIGSPTPNGAPNPTVTPRATTSVPAGSTASTGPSNNAQPSVQPTTMPASSSPYATVNPSTGRIEVFTPSPADSSRPGATQPSAGAGSAKTNAPATNAPSSTKTDRADGTRVPATSITAPVTQAPNTTAPVPQEPPTTAPVTQDPTTTAPVTTAPAETDPPVDTGRTTHASPTTRDPAGTASSDPPETCHDNRDGCKKPKKHG